MTPHPSLWLLDRRIHLYHRLRNRCWAQQEEDYGVCYLCVLLHCVAGGFRQPISLLHCQSWSHVGLYICWHYWYWLMFGSVMERRRDIRILISIGSPWKGCLRGNGGRLSSHKKTRVCRRERREITCRNWKRQRFGQGN